MNNISSQTNGLVSGVADSFGRRAVTMQGRIGDWMRRRAIYARTVRELSALTDRDLADLGISRTDIRRLARDGAFGA